MLGLKYRTIFVSFFVNAWATALRANTPPAGFTICIVTQGCCKMRWALAGALLLAAVVLANELRSERETAKPPWQRLLQGDDATKAATLESRITELMQAQKWGEARKAADDLAKLRADKQGKAHWQAVDAGVQEGDRGEPRARHARSG